MSARSMTTVITADTMALNAAMFGFGGHSALTPHQAIQQQWWTDERINAKVTRDFIVSKLRPNERDQLFQPMFGDDALTEDTYLDWILTRSKRIFLTLVECNCSDQIFGIAEDGWDDDDLPIPVSEIPRLALSYKNDDSLNKRFYNNQFRFILRPLNLHGHIDYESTEVVPTEYVHKLAPAAAVQKWSRFHLPKMPTLIYAKRKFILGDKGEIKPELLEQFLEDVATLRTIEHDHIAPIMATWTHHGAAFVMTPFVAEHTLRSFIDFRVPASLQKTSTQDRTRILLPWLHCLANATAYLHRKRIAHSAICPSNIVIDENNNIAFSDLGFLETFQKDKKLDADELYNYGAPEQFDSDQRQKAQTSRQPVAPRTFLRRRRDSNSSKGSGSDRSGESSPALSVDPRGNYVFKSRSNSDATITPLTSTSSRTMHDFDVPVKLPQSFDNRFSASSKGTITAISITSEPRSTSSEAYQRCCDIYSLACVFLDIITFVLKQKAQDFTKYRSTKYKKSLGRGTQIDASFHSNVDKVHTWMELLEKEASLASGKDRTLDAIPRLLDLISDMLNPDPLSRPTAAKVQDRVHDALSNHGDLKDLHCSNTFDLRPASATLSFNRSSTSGGSSEPKLAAFPEIGSLKPPPLPQKSAKRPKPEKPKKASAPKSWAEAIPETPFMPVPRKNTAPTKPKKSKDSPRPQTALPIRSSSAMDFH